MHLSSALPDEKNQFADLVVSSVQMAPRIGQKQDNLARSVELIERAAARGTHLVVLPELVNCGYMFESREEAFALAENIPGGESTSLWSEVAQRLGLYIVAGLAEREGDKLYNSAVLIGPKGYVGRYRKLHLWSDEHLFFEAGDLGLPVFHTEIGRIGVVICYDGWFPEVYRLLAMKGADLVCMPTNWVPMAGQVSGTTAMANMLAMASAHANGLAIVCADRIGTERGQAFIGQSLIVGANGFPLAGPASQDQEEIISARINLKVSRKIRHLNAFNHVLHDRRIDIYDPMLGTGWPLRR